MSILIKNANIITMNQENEEFLGDILIEGSAISKIGSNLNPERVDQIIDATGMVAMPGLINCHNHAAMVLFRGYSDDLRLMEWLNEKIWPAEDKLTPEDIYWGTMLSIAEMIRTGTTTFADMYFEMDHVAKAVDETGIRASLSRGLIYSDEMGIKNLDETDTFISNHHRSSDGRVTCMYGPHAPFTCPPKYLEEVLLRAEKNDIPIHIHLAETSEEVEIMHRDYGKSPTKYLSDLGYFKHHVLLAHSVNLSRDDVYLLKGMKGGVSHNPVSNMKLGCGVAPILLMKELNISVGLGTDGAGSATTLDLFEEMKAAAWMHKNITADPTAIDSQQVLTMATLEGAKLLNIDKHVGSLEVGKKADIILVDMEKPHLYPKTNNLKALLSYSATGFDVRTSIIDGKVIMRDYQLLTFDVAEVLRQAQKVVERILI